MRGILFFCFIWFASFAELLAASATHDYKRMLIPLGLWALGIAYLFRKDINRWLNKSAGRN